MQDQEPEYAGGVREAQLSFADCTEPVTRRNYDRASCRTDEEREQHYQDWLKRSEAYFQAIADAGDAPWFGSDTERRELFFRRYTRPTPPQGIPDRDPREFRP